MEAIGQAYDIYQNIGDLLGALQGFAILFQIAFVLALLLLYFVMGYVHMCIGHKAGIQSDWMAFIPITRQLYQMRIANCPWWYIFLFKTTTVTVTSVGLISYLIFLLTKKPAIIVVLFIIYVIANLVITFMYYSKYYYYFGFNSSAAWIDIVPGFAFIATVVTVLIAFSDSIHFRGASGPVAQEEVIRMDKKVPVKSGKKAIIKGMTGKYADATFDISDGGEIVFGRSATDCNIIFDQYATDVSRKHCGIRFDGESGQYIVLDYSSNGTFMDDGTRLEKSQEKRMSRGTVIYLGNRKNTFRLE